MKNKEQKLKNVIVLLFFKLCKRTIDKNKILIIITPLITLMVTPT